MTGNYYYQNDKEIKIVKGEAKRKTLLSFDVPSGEVLDFFGNLTTKEQDTENHRIYFELEKDGQVVATSCDRTAEGNADNLSLALLYQAKMDKDSTFEVVAQAHARTHYIPESQLQIEFKTYGEGLELTLL